MRTFDLIGGDELRAVLADFYDRVFDDAMIGFFFFGKDKAALIEREWQFTARMLGNTEIAYSGRPMREAHASAPILGGQFARRQKILDEVLLARGVHPEVRRVWLAHNLALRPQVTAQQPGECQD